MFMMTIVISLSVVLLLLFLIQFGLGSSADISDPQLSVIESGFEALKYSSQLSASFFMLAVLFVLFDLELLLVLPFIFAFKVSISTLLVLGLVLVFISMTLMWEWVYHGLKWSS